MEIKKLKSLLKSQITSLSVNAFGWSVLLYLTYAMSSAWWGIVWALYAIYLYNRFLKHEASRPALLFFSFALVSLLGIISSGDNSAALLVSVVSGALIWIALASGALFLSNPKAGFAIFYHATVFGSVAYFASFSPSNVWWGLFVFLYLLIYTITRDYIKIETGGYDRRKKIFTLVLSLAIIQCAWMASLLPLGFLNVGSLSLIVSIVATDLFFNRLAGTLTKKAVARGAAFFGGFVALVFLVGMI